MSKTYAWAWAIETKPGKWELCYWAMATRRLLMQEPRPSPEARAMRVELVPTSKRNKSLLRAKP